MPDDPQPNTGPRPNAAPGADTSQWQNRAQARGYPPDHGPEQRVLRVHPAMFRARPLSFIGLVAAQAVCVTGIIYGLAAGLVWLWPMAAVVLAIAVVAFLVWKLQQISSSIEITNKRTIQSVGLFSKRTSEVLHDNIRNVKIAQTFWERVWNIGSLELSSVAEGDEVRAAKIKDPDELRTIIDLYRPL